MPRGSRIILENVCYHIINRGNQKQNIFIEYSDFEKYLKILKHYKRKYGIKLLGYCLMPNHVHLIIEMDKPDNLAKAMQSLTQSYTKFYNNKYKKVGHLWQGRFKSMIIQKDAYFTACVYYVENNPIRAGLTQSPADYPWSSYKERVFSNKGGILDFPDST